MVHDPLRLCHVHAPGRRGAAAAHPFQQSRLWSRAPALAADLFDNANFVMIAIVPLTPVTAQPLQRASRSPPRSPRTFPSSTSISRQIAPRTSVPPRSSSWPSAYSWSAHRQRRGPVVRRVLRHPHGQDHPGLAPGNPTALPQTIAAFHQLVGTAATCASIRSFCEHPGSTPRPASSFLSALTPGSTHRGGGLANLFA